MMNKIIPIALTITGDEKAIGLTETNYQSPGNKGMHRYQCIYVVRDGNMAEFRRDLGPSEKFRGVNLINIPGGGGDPYVLEHTVDELMDIADEIRGQTKIDVKDLLELENYKPA